MVGSYDTLKMKTMRPLIFDTMMSEQTFLFPKSEPKTTLSIFNTGC